jgi:biotin synthase
MNMNLDHLLAKCRETGNLGREEIITLLSLEDQSSIDRLIAVADEVRKENIGDDVHIRGLIEFSNFCRCQCNYCGLRANNTRVERYRMSEAEILEVALGLEAKGIRTAVLQSGEDLYYSSDDIASIIKTIKSNTSLAVTLCIGERPYEDYKLWKEAGADRYLLRHEAANKELYTQLHPSGSYENRMQCLPWLKELGYQVGAGGMVGAPGQTIEHLADDIEFYRDFQPDMIGVGPFISHPDTPYGEEQSGSVQMTLKMVALARIVTRSALLPATTAIGSLEEQGREMALMAGADVVMPNYTPMAYREKYEIYPNKRCVTENPEQCLGCLKLRIKSVGRTVSTTHGHARRKG